MSYMMSHPFSQIQMQDFTASLPKRLIEVRKLQGLTQVQVAKILGTTQGTYALYESGAQVRLSSYCRS